MERNIRCEWSYSETVNYGMQQNHVPVVKRIVITNPTEEEIRGITIKLTSEPQFAHEWSRSYELLPAGQSIDLGAINLQMSAAYLGELSERITGTLTLSVWQGESEILQERGNISVLAFDEWSGLAILPEMIAAYVTPNHQHIFQIVREAADILGTWSGNSSFTAYQSKDPNRVRIQAAAIYSALQNRGIAYCVAPPSFELIGQRVRLPESIFTHRIGNCLDLSLLYAACLEAIGLHPLLIFTEGHAFSGVWLEEETFAESVQDDISVLTKRIATGINEICIIESTAFVEGPSISFDRAAQLAEAHLQDPDKFDCLVDIRRARAAAIRPLPLRTAGADGWIIEQLEQSQMETAATAAPEILDVLEKPTEVDSLPRATRQKLWERRLLDLTLRNSLLNFRLSKSSIPVITAQLGDLEDALAEGEEFQLLAKPGDWENNGRNATLYQSINADHPLAQLLREEFNRKRLRIDLSANDLERRVVHLYRSAKSSLEENGANTLYLALGLLKWYESPVSEVPRYAPIVLIPVDILRKSSRLGYVIRARDEEPHMNITLLEMLKQDFGIGIDGLDPLPRDEKGIALKQVFNVFRHALINISRWDVEETAYLGLFSFGQFVMWNDIRTRADKLAENKIVASLMEGKLKWQEDSNAAVGSLDKDHPTSLAIPISADSSQLSAIRAATDGQSFVLHGPPGTGKSQTITNMIANALAKGKRVLFVAEKMAALSVVQRRLEQIGVGSFCLELHSNKSTKKSVLDQLASAIETRRVLPSEAWGSQAERLFQLRSELNGYVEALHHKHHFGLSLFDAISGYEKEGSVEGLDAVRFNEAAIEGLNPEKLVAWKDLTSQIQVAGSQCGDPFRNPWSDARIISYSQTVKSDVDQLLKRYIPELSRLRGTINKTAERFKLEHSGLTYSNITVLVRFCELASRVPDIKPALLQATDADASMALLQAAADQGRRRDKLREKVLSRFTSSEILRFDAKMMLSEWNRMELQWFLPKWSGQNRILKMMKKLLISGNTLSKDQVKDSLIEIISWQEEEQKLNEAKGDAAPLLGHSLIWNEEGKWEEISEAGNWLKQVQELLVKWFQNSSLASQARSQMAELLVNGREDTNQNQLFSDVTESFNRITEDEKKLAELLAIQYEQLRSTPDAEDWFAFILDKAGLWATHLDGLRDWSTWRRIRSLGEEAGLLPLIIPYEQGALTNDQLHTGFERGLYKAMANYIIARDERLRAFSGTLFEEAINRFKEADDYFSQLTQQEIVARLSSKIPQMTQEAAQSSEAGILQRAIRSGGRNISIRKLFEQIPNLLPRLVPCMLMSPISVAQYLDSNGAKFDLVIFDEASQVPTAQAVGALARGNQAVIVGDPKQLPPTSFFSKSSNESEDEDQSLQDMESILDDCLALGMPERHLSWHYRSRHESLIAFSNAHYYDNKLLTFPSPDEPVSSVTWYPIEGFYDRGRTKQNRAEGEAVVSEIIRRVKDPLLRERSIGVVTFSSIQQTLIEDMLEDAFKQEPELEILLAKMSEPLFVKNLENVQGDERDVILFSVGYGPDSSGKVSLNFGPLNRQGGWRRLNVAVSRARHEMLVFSTLRSHHLNASRISAQGVLGLKAFLEYAEKGKRALPVGEALEQIPLISNLHRGLTAELKIHGYDTEAYVGVSGYRVDIGILDPDNQGQYILGILLDGPMYQNAETARDRDILREQVLKQLGWTIYRVWSPDWWENKGRNIRLIIEAIQHAKDDRRKGTLETNPESGHSMKRVQTAPPSKLESLVEASLPSKPEEIHDYIQSSLDPVPLGSDLFNSPANTELILGQIKQVIKEEGPISRGLLTKRVLQAWGITRLGTKLDQRFTELFNKVKPQTTETEGAVFFWPDEVEPYRYGVFRVSLDESQRRIAEDLPPEEIAAAVKFILASQISLPQEELIKQVVKILGYARSGSALEKAVKNGIQKAIELDYVVVDEQQRIVTK
ncbi:DUF3320 domain-containing protein [Paenibacillus sp. H1-7]|uniref:DUF3320 domain-containing protein n=1 Tax=Paenibacillus sp. H1-7 TaxID=2282849 RepID=UPI001EF888E8|nr:DUF3320 domain-containing protein [Paenibacillus sp. H1-7]ULL13802.1 DUF3320 domain-containing protein [Paenibacillus sp. H1-7]